LETNSEIGNIKRQRLTDKRIFKSLTKKDD